MSEITTTPEAQPREYKRFSPSVRFEHMILLLSFTGLAVTGLPQRYPDMAWAKTAIELMGGIESVRIVHRILATILMAETIYHGGILSYKIFVLGHRATMIPTLKDAKDVFQWIGFNLGFIKQHPNLPRYNFGEKVEYLAVVWGTLVMIFTGFMMWNPIAMNKVFPASAIPAARAAHSAEALLAVLSIIVWHMYNVHIRRFNRSMFTGNLPRDAMEEEHGEELEAIERGEMHRNPPAEVIIRRQRWFIPYAAIVTLLLTAGLVYFTTIENSATVSLAERQTEINTTIDPSIGDAEQGGILWTEQQCDVCHGENADTTSDLIVLVNEDIDFETFIIATREGPADMPGYTTAQITDEEIAHLWAWYQSVLDQ